LATGIPDASSTDCSTRGLQSLEVVDFRNIGHARLCFAPGINLITGANAAGKTSLLEAIYCLGRVHSFRTTDARRLIREGRECWRLVGRIGLTAGRSIPVGIERCAGNYRVHLAGRPLNRLSGLAGQLPVHLMSGDTANSLNGGPRYRRQTLDWALFHVEHGYREAWQRYARILRQRNAALRARAPMDLVVAWDAELLNAAAVLNRLRRSYLQDLGPNLQAELKVLLPGVELELRYRPGWPQDQSLSEALLNSRERDYSRGYTHVGPQRADFSLYEDDRPVVARFSRGQQKATVLAFLLGQLRLQQQRAATSGLFLLDDLASEMDPEHQARIVESLGALDTQVFVTAINTRTIDNRLWAADRRFHVEHGVIQEVV